MPVLRSRGGFCPACRTIAPLEPDGPGLRCGRPGCGVALVKCRNYAVEGVCNRCLVLGAPASPPGFCDACRYDDTIPDLSVPGNREKWSWLERAKRRLLYTLDRLGLPHGRAEDGVVPALSFDVKADVPVASHPAFRLGDAERVVTGHEDGKITINIREADPVEREKARVSLGEAQRSLVGHFHHEIGHYYWQMLVQGRDERGCAERFGDPAGSVYADALERHCREGPAAGWQGSFLSAYASMHPFEDFAETFAAYLDMVSVLDTATHLGLPDAVDPLRAPFDEMVPRYLRVCLVANELNRTMGLLDLFPGVFTEPILAKLRYVHDLVRPFAAGAG